MVVLAGSRKYYWLELHEKIQKMGLGPFLMPLNFKTDLDYHLNTKKKSLCSQLLIIMCLGRGLGFQSVLVFIINWFFTFFFFLFIFFV